MAEKVYIYITDHGQKRFKQRSGLPKRLVTQKAQEAVERGLRPSDTAGRLRRYIEDLQKNDRRADRVYLYNNLLYMFRGKMLVTVLVLPQEYRLSAIRAQKRKHGTAIS